MSDGTHSPSFASRHGDDQDGDDTKRDAARERGCLEQIDDHRQQGGGEQDLDDRLDRTSRGTSAKRLAGQGRESVCAELARLSPTSASVNPAARQLGKSSTISRSERMSTSW